MNKTARLITTDSYFNIFNVLGDELQKRPNGLNDNAVIFCEEKFSLLAERVLCNAKKGSFSTAVYSFGNYLKKHFNSEKVLTREGSSMAIKRVLKTLPLKCFNKSRNTISSSVYNLIVQLKSAKISPEDINKAKDDVDGILKNKLEDIYLVYSAYERFIKDNGFDDQSSVLSYLPDTVYNDKLMQNTDVYLVGYTSWTRQALNVIEALLKCAKSVTAILPNGKNEFSFVGETSKNFIKVCEQNGITVNSELVASPYVKEGKTVCDNLFNPASFKLGKYETDKVNLISASNENDEVERVAEIIKNEVINGNKKYADFTIALSEPEKQDARIKRIFSTLDIPFFLDVKKKGENTALISLILSYTEAFRKNYERSTVCSFIKNPFFGLDKSEADKFENYLINYNINYSKIKQPFTLKTKGEDLDKLNGIREKVTEILSNFNVRKMLDKLNAEEKNKEFCEKLKELNLYEESAVNEQVYGKVTGILDEIDLILGKDVSVAEFKETFLSGIKALELSIIPQYQDAVFIGDYKECALYQNKTVFALNLTSSVPNVKEDVAILTDGDISVLENVKVLVEPKIRIVNHRYRENVSMALSCFTERLFLCCPITTDGGKRNVKSEIMDYADSLFTLGVYNKKLSYLTAKQGINSFSRDCTMFADRRIDDIENASNFYFAVKPNEKAEKVLDIAYSQIDKEIKIDRPLISGVISPTVLENYSKCPYKAFIEYYLRVGSRDNGEVNALSAGNIIHEVFEKFIKDIDQIKDEGDIENKVSSILKVILEKDKYKRYLLDDKDANSIDRIKRESVAYCKKIFKSLQCSSFKPKYVEKRFGDGKENSLPPIELLGGKVKLKGIIDRVDEYKDYVRIIDYKTGSVDTDKKNLFTGNKLQLNLYSQVFKDKKIAGSYYMPVSNGFKSGDKKDKELLFIGDTLNDSEVINAQDSGLEKNESNNIISTGIKDGEIKNGVSEDKIKAFNEYAYLAAQKIAGNLIEGYVPASPFEETCEYCEFRSVCNNNRTENRTVAKINDDTISKAVEGDK